MNRVTFQLKRANHQALALGHDILEEFDLTPARFDLLRVVHMGRDKRAMQKGIRLALGVAGSTVSRMLRSLEVLGFITRATGKDRRTKVVALTEPTAQLMERLVDRLTHYYDEMMETYERALTGKRPGSAPAVEACARWFEDLWKVARNIGDRSTMRYLLDGVPPGTAAMMAWQDEKLYTRRMDGLDRYDH